MELEEGSVLDGRYKLDKKIGAGGFGTVYKATQISTGQAVAIKVLNGNKLVADSSANLEIARFEREMKLIAQLKHPNVVRLIDTGQLSETDLYTVLEYVEGDELAELIKEHGALKPREAKDLMFQVLDALAAAHQQGIVHRDMKPQNIMVTTQGFRRNAMVLDFGIAGIAEEARQDDYQTLTMAGRIQGTPAYMAPEQLRGESTSASIDIYAWGLVFLEVVTGRQAITGNSMVDLLAKQVAPAPVPIPEELLQTEIGQVIAKATAKKVEERYQSADEALRDLDACNVPAELSFSWTGTSATDEQMNSSSISRPQFTPRGGMAANGMGNAETMSYDSGNMSGPIPVQSSNKLIVILIVLVLVLGGVAGAIFFFISSGDDDKGSANAATKDSDPETREPGADVSGAGGDPVEAGADTSSAQGGGEDPPTEQDPGPPSYENGVVYDELPGAQGASMVFLEGGTFSIGSDAQAIDRQVEICKAAAGKYAAVCKAELFADQSPATERTVASFFLDIHEATNADYTKCVDAGKCQENDVAACHALTNKGPFGSQKLSKSQVKALAESIRKDELPVTCVSRSEAEAYCRWAGKVLPDEAQWELAASNKGERLFPWGDEDEGGGRRANGADLTLSEAMGWKKNPKILVRMGARNVDRFPFTAKVFSYPDGVSATGVFDLSGNVKEWVDGAYEPYGEGGTIDPEKKGQAIARGGSWADIGPWLGARVRAPLPSDARRTDLGFRCALPLETITSREGSP